MNDQEMPNVEFRPPPSPGEFTRPYIDAGTAREAASTTPDAWSNATPPPTSTPNPAEFQRGLLTDGHQRRTSPVGGADPQDVPPSGVAIDRTKPRGDDDATG